MSTVPELIHRAFCDRNAAHLEHWATKSYARHMALGGFYDDVIEKIDAFVEAYQGQYGLVPKMAEEEKEESVHDGIADCLRDTSDWIASNMDAICMKDATLENLLQDLHAAYLSTLYKLDNLS